MKIATLLLLFATSVIGEADIPFEDIFLDVDATNAQGTPDDVPPAWETVCEKASGGDNQAFGLCIAYCEARDCDLGPNSKPCEQLRENYMKITGAAMPCDFDCPCIDGLEGWTDALNTIDGEECYDFYESSIFYDYAYIRFADDSAVWAWDFDYLSKGQCGFSVSGSPSSLLITPDEADQCKSFLISLATSNNLVRCQPT